MRRDRRVLPIDHPLSRYEEAHRRQSRSNQHAADSNAQWQHRWRVATPAHRPVGFCRSQVPLLPEGEPQKPVAAEMYSGVTDWEIVFLYVFAMIALTVGQPEQPLLQDWVFPVPQSQREAKLLTVVGNAAQAVFAPSICTRSRLIVAEVVPRVARIAVVLPHRSPLPLGQIRPSFLPRSLAIASIFKPFLFRRHASSKN